MAEAVSMRCRATMAAVVVRVVVVAGITKER